MGGFYLMLVLWAYSIMLMAAFFCLTLERRYSVKATILGTVGYYIVTCILRVPVFLNSGIQYLFLLNAASILVLFLYQIACFRARWQLRILSVTIILVFMSTVELIAGRLGVMIVGSVTMLDFDSRGWIVSCLLCFLLTGFTIYPVVWIWHLFLKIKWEQNMKSWLSILFPISQYIVMESYLENYWINDVSMSYIVIVGLMIGILADFYMFILFYIENQRIRAEKELAKQKHLYELERLRYENILEGQKEASRIRHDFQNYILTIRGLSEYQQGEKK